MTKLFQFTVSQGRCIFVIYSIIELTTSSWKWNQCINMLWFDIVILISSKPKRASTDIDKGNFAFFLLSKKVQKIYRQKSRKVLFTVSTLNIEKKRMRQFKMYENKVIGVWAISSAFYLFYALHCLLWISLWIYLNVTCSMCTCVHNTSTWDSVWFYFRIKALLFFCRVLFSGRKSRREKMPLASVEYFSENEGGKVGSGELKQREKHKCVVIKARWQKPRCSSNNNKNNHLSEYIWGISEKRRHIKTRE